MMTILKKALLAGLVLTLAIAGTVAAEANPPTLSERIDMAERSLGALERALGGGTGVAASVDDEPVQMTETAAAGSAAEMGVPNDVSERVHAMKDLIMTHEGAFTFTRAVVKDGLLILSFSYKNTTEVRQTISDLYFFVKDADGNELSQTWECDLPWFDGMVESDAELSGDVCFVFSKSSAYTISYEPFKGTALTWALTN